MTGWGKSRGALFASASIALVLACKSGAAPSPSSPSPTAAVACGALFDAFTAYAACGAIAPVQGSEARFAQFCEARVGAPGAGSVTAVAAQCAEAIQSAAATCGPLDATACAAPAGTLVAGAACGTGLQCASLYCVGPASNTAELATSFLYLGFTSLTSCGTCVDRVAVGAPCAVSLPQCGAGCDVLPPPCEDGASCEVTSGAGQTACVAAPSEGPAQAAGGSCARQPCANGNRCESGSQVCVPAQDAGEGCDTSNDCQLGFVCTENACTAGKSAGATCAIANDGTSDCAAGTTCEAAAMTCVATTYGAPGASCDGIHALCEAGFCDFPSGSGTSQGTCPAVIPDGVACLGTSAGETCDAYATCMVPAPAIGCCEPAGPGTTGSGGGPAGEEAGAAPADAGPSATCVALDPSTCK